MAVDVTEASFESEVVDRLSQTGIGSEVFEAIKRGDREAALDALIAELQNAQDGSREDLRRAIVGILSELDPGDPTAREYRRKLAAVLG